MSKIVWDAAGQRFYETGVDQGVLYIPDSNGAYVNGVPWNGLVSVSEAPSGAEPNPIYADNMKYLTMVSAEEFAATIEAYTFPDEFLAYDGMSSPSDGVNVGQQPRTSFGLSYRTRKGNDVDGDDHGYKLHLIYNALAAPSQKDYQTINDSPEAITFSWEISTTPVPVNVNNLKPTSILTIDSTKVDADALSDLEDFLYGTVGTDPSLPTPAAVIALFTGTVTEVTPSEPAFDQGTNTITIPTVTGVTYYVEGEAVPAGALVITEDTVVTARPDQGYKFPAVVDDDWFYNYV